jgi:hypothetical protein
MQRGSPYPRGTHSSHNNYGSPLRGPCYTNYGTGRHNNHDYSDYSDYSDDSGYESRSVVVAPRGRRILQARGIQAAPFSPPRNHVIRHIRATRDDTLDVSVQVQRRQPQHMPQLPNVLKVQASKAIVDGIDYSKCLGQGGFGKVYAGAHNLMCVTAVHVCHYLCTVVHDQSLHAPGQLHYLCGISCFGNVSAMPAKLLINKHATWQCRLTRVICAGVYKGGSAAYKVIDLAGENQSIHKLAVREVQNLKEASNKIPDYVIGIKTWYNEDNKMFIVMEEAWGTLAEWSKGGMDLKKWVCSRLAWQLSMKIQLENTLYAL